jgi:hypothetical protein
MTSTPAGVPPAPPAGAPAAGTGQAPGLLDTLGLPQEGGRLSWPLGLRILAPGPDTQALRQQIDALLQMAAAQQAAGGKVSPSTLQELNAAADRLQALLARAADRRVLPEAVQSEADQFLRKLRDAVKAMR